MFFSASLLCGGNINKDDGDRPGDGRGLLLTGGSIPAVEEQQVTWLE